LIIDAMHHSEHAGPGIAAHHQEPAISTDTGRIPAIQERR
jgi:hypothetical protein